MELNMESFKRDERRNMEKESENKKFETGRQKLQEDIFQSMRKQLNIKRSFQEDKPVIDNLISFREFIDQNKISITNNRDELYDEYWNIQKKKITCECGAIILRAYLPQHKKKNTAPNL
jgi:hypothetical protein